MKLETIGPGVLKVTLPETRERVLTMWAGDPGFARSFSDAIAAVPFAGVYFETPSLTTETLGLPFECVVVDGAALAGLQADPAPFRAQLRGPDPIVTFENLGGDALLVAPIPVEGVDCAHLAAFLRSAGDEQIVGLWRAVALAVRSVLGTTPRWVSTAGLGVSWLHVRIDRTPKYYRHRPYRMPDPGSSRPG
jgi:hypothetical protein